jgi:hypothetical protein
MDEPISKNNMFGSCPQITPILNELDDKQQSTFVRQLYESFGESFLAVVQSDIMAEWINSKIVFIMKNRLIRPAMKLSYDELLEKIQNSKKVDFTDFIVDNAMISKGDMENMIKRAETFEDAKEKIRPFLQ